MTIRMYDERLNTAKTVSDGQVQTTGGIQNAESK
jgi:hypothetical protein